MVSLSGQLQGRNSSESESGDPGVIVFAFDHCRIYSFDFKKCFSIITVNFTRLVEGMEQVKRGDLKTKVQAETQDEISILIREFNEMMMRIDELIKRVEAEQLLVKETEIKALQQQINPHFIYNVLETIMGLASEGLDDEVIEVSTCLSDAAL